MSEQQPPPQPVPPDQPRRLTRQEQAALGRTRLQADLDQQTGAGPAATADYVNVNPAAPARRRGLLGRIFRRNRQSTETADNAAGLAAREFAQGRVRETQQAVVPVDDEQRRLDARTAEERRADVARRMQEAQDRQDAELAAQRERQEEPAPLEEHIPAKDRPMARSLFRRLGGLTVSVGKNWINSIDPRGRDRWWALGVGVGAVESVVVGTIPLGPVNGLIKAGLNLALAQTLHAGVKTRYDRLEREDSVPEDYYAEYMRSMIERHNRANQRVRNFLLGVSAGATYFSVTGIVMNMAGGDEQFLQRMIDSVKPESISSPAASETPTATVTSTPTATETTAAGAPATETPTTTDTPTTTETATATDTSTPTATATPTATGTPTPTATETPTGTATTTPAAPQAAPPPVPHPLVGPEDLPPPAYEPPQAAPPRPLPVGPEDLQPAYQPPQFASVPRPAVGPDQYPPPAYEPPPPAVTQATKDYLEKLVAANPDLAKAPASLVGEHLEQTNIAAREALAAAGIDPSRLSADSYDKIRKAVQYKLEEQVNASLAKTAEQLVSNTDPAMVVAPADSSTVIATTRSLFEQSFDPTSAAHQELLNAANSVITEQKALHDQLLQSVAQEIGKPGELAAEVMINRGTTVGQMLVESGYNLSWGATDAEVLGAHIAANHDLLNSFWGQMASAGNLPEGFHYPADLAEISDLVEQAKNGDAQALQKLKDALHWIPSGQKFKILSKAGISGVLSTIK